MDENIGQREKRKRKRRELLIIVLFLLASIFLCSLSLILGVGNSAAAEFVPVSMRALNEGDYSADNPLFQFQKANLDLIMDVLLDRDPLAADIVSRATAIAYNLLTPVPTITPQVGDESITNKITPSINTTMAVTWTQVLTKTATVTPTNTLTNQPAQTATTKPIDVPITWPTQTAPRSPSATPKPTKMPANPATKTATSTITSTPTATETSISTATAIATNTPTPTATDTPTSNPNTTATSTSTSTPTATETPISTATAITTSTSTPTATDTSTSTPTPTYTPTPTATLTPNPTPELPECYIGIPSGFSPSDDAFIRESSPTSNFGDLPDIDVRSDDGANRRGFVRFDLSSIPQGSAVTSATLYLYEKDSKQGQVTYIYKVTSAWDENSVTWISPWLNPGGDFDNSQAYASFPPNQSNCMLTIDLADLVQEWINGSPNYGFLLYSTGPNHILRYSSKENSAVDERPKLHITYVEPSFLSEGLLYQSTSYQLAHALFH